MIDKTIAEHLQERREVHSGIKNGAKLSEYRKEREMCMTLENN